MAVLAAESVIPCRAATFSTNSTIDAFVTTGPTGNLSGNNYGGAGVLVLAAQSASNNTQGTFQSVLQFNVAGALSAFNSQYGVGQWTIQSVTLQLNSAAANNGIFNQASTAGQFGISFMQNNSWTEGNGTPMSLSTTGGVNYNSLPNFLSANNENLGTFNYNGATSGLSSYSLGLTPGFTSDIVSGGEVSLNMFADDNSINYLFNSRNFGTAADRPLLTITAVPEPGVTALCLSGLGLLAAGRFGRGSIRRS
jgi:hypothetical protein